MIIDSNNILVLAPHTDDGELGLGGTIHKFIFIGKMFIMQHFQPLDKLYRLVFQKML